MNKIEETKATQMMQPMQKRKMQSDHQSIDQCNGCQDKPEEADCVTEVRIGNSVLIVSGYYKKEGKATAADRMAKVMETDQRLLERAAL